MKSKYLFLAFAASAVFVGCSNEDLTAIGADNSVAKNIINADDVRFEVSKADAATKAVWEQDGTSYDFNWDANDKIGVAYIGDAGNEMESKGVTNYYFKVDSLYDSALTLDENPSIAGETKYTTKFAPTAVGTGTAWNDWLASYGKSSYTVPTKSERAKFETVNDYIFEGYYAV